MLLVALYRSQKHCLLSVFVGDLLLKLLPNCNNGIAVAEERDIGRGGIAKSDVSSRARNTLDREGQSLVECSPCGLISYRNCRDGRKCSSGKIEACDIAAVALDQKGGGWGSDAARI